MKLAIMQPYFFPYIGYWQLIFAADTFVIYDDVNYIKKGYINRNSILVSGANHLLILELLGASQNKKINEIGIGGNIPKILKTIEHAYKKSPYFENIFPIIKKVLNNQEKNLSQFLLFSITIICEYLDIQTKFIISSEINKNNELRGQDKIINICESLQATKYINAIGGQDLYQKEMFSQKGTELLFIKSKSIDYLQFQAPFVPNLSIIDMLMFNNKEQVKQYLTEFELI